MSVTFVVRVRLPLVPLIVNVEVPFGVFEAVLTERVHELVVEAGLNVPTAPLGRPDTLSATGSANPPLGVIVIV